MRCNERVHWLTFPFLSSRLIRVAKMDLALPRSLLSKRLFPSPSTFEPSLFGHTILGGLSCCVSLYRSPSCIGFAEGASIRPVGALAPKECTHPLCLILRVSCHATSQPVGNQRTGLSGTTERPSHTRTRSAPAQRADRAGACTGASLR
jgi:hypothetical protein